ncbi:lysophosphatidic acid receptor 1-A-like [Paramormyrops kingsleyae]|uniref:Lysophosphatidic acid receptor 2 n=1 Tax=Paramormyrops kingsleyae TaxID=1676925 RepID=A0A3B3SZL1_9TELE|nr:lysophosphatidic acid receptor 1-A-like [Paramormyrops kingsleyae]XP_023677691.1 lysophosphatidic acid receptor 1-A-like [Paramormyrops kingsleyae]
MCIEIVGDDAPGCYCNRTLEFFYNHSGKYINDSWTSQSLLVVILGIIVCAFILFANSLVMVAIIINRGFHYPIYYLLGNLAAADLFAGASYLYLMFHTGPWTKKLSKPQWFLRQGLIDTSLTASVVNLLAVAVERHQTIFTMQLHSKMSNRRVTLLILGIWLVALLMGLIPSMGWHCLCDVENCSIMAPLYSRSYLVFWAVLNLVTFTIMVVVYLRIFLYVRRKSQRMSQHTTQTKHKETVVSLMKTVTMILGAFVICWTPGLVILLVDGLEAGKSVLIVEKYFLVLAECNSLINPIIYSLRDKEMLSTFKRILCCLCRRGGVQGSASSVRFDTLRQETLKSNTIKMKKTMGKTAQCPNNIPATSNDGQTAK